MNKLIVQIMIFISCNLIAQVQMFVISDLEFPDQYPQVNQDIMIRPFDMGAAIIRVTGGVPNANVSCTFTRNNITVSVPPNSNINKRMTVKNFTLSCPGKFDASGMMDVRIGATVTQSSSDVSGSYSSNPHQALKITY